MIKISRQYTTCNVYYLWWWMFCWQKGLSYKHFPRHVKRVTVLVAATRNYENTQDIFHNFLGFTQVKFKLHKLYISLIYNYGQKTWDLKAYLFICRQRFIQFWWPHLIQEITYMLESYNSKTLLGNTIEPCPFNHDNHEHAMTMTIYINRK